MATEVTQTDSFYKAWAWFETHKKQVAWGASIVVVLGLLTWFILWQRGEKEVAASEALAQISSPHIGMSGARADSGEAYLKIIANYPKSEAATRALLLAAGSFFVDGKYDQAKAQFERFLREHRGSPLSGQALLGIAASLAAQGKTNEALTAYKDLVDHYPRDTATPQAKFALGRLYEAQNKPDQAFAMFEDLVKTEPYGSLGSEAGMRSEELKMKFPYLGVNTNLPPATIIPPTPQIKLEDSQSNAAPGTGTTAVPLPSSPGAATTPVPQSSTTGAPAIPLTTPTNVVPLFAPSNSPSSPSSTNVTPPKQ